jgi:Ca2+-transporting ATPase
MRDGRLVQVPTRDLVGGDLVRVEAGERVPADGTLVDGEGVLADEAILTGESLPVEKGEAAELQSGTLIVRGKGLLRVTRTGPRSALGTIAAMLGEIRPEQTPLERRLGSLGKQIAIAVSILSVVLVVAGVAVEGVGRFPEAIMFAVALAVAAIPEGMPAVVTLTLALGVQRMARRHALVRKLSAVEALGSVTVIATDKTGTLTEEHMSVHALATDDAQEALLAMVLANDADTDASAGDPLDVGLVRHARGAGLDVGAARLAHPRLRGRPFDSAWKFMRATVQATEGSRSYLKGAPEALLPRVAATPEQRGAWLERAERAAERGYKVLALARGEGESEERLDFLGLAMLWDPPRAEVPDAIAKAQRAGVRVLMITGDHPATARGVAGEIGIPTTRVVTGDEIDRLPAEELRTLAREAHVFARVTPAHKLRLVEALKADGQIVAMTGDGVNDAPALKRADVGIAMGKRGSDVAREVADLVLLDDDFATIVGAIEEGRGIYENIQAFIRFTFSTNVALMVLVVTGAVVAQLEGLRDASGFLVLPLTALQLLWINFLGDGPPALALGLDRTPGQMNRPPRPPRSALLDPSSMRFIVATGAFKGILGIALLTLLPVVGYGLVVTQTAIFLYESVGKLVSAYPSRRDVAGRRANVSLHVSIVLGVALQVLTILVPGLRRFLGLEPLGLGLALILVAAVTATWAFAALASRLVGHGRRTPRARDDTAPSDLVRPSGLSHAPSQ